MSMSSSLTTANIIENDYKLALKLFMNKSFSQSWQILCNLYGSLWTNVNKGTITEGLFVKVLNLYLTEVGLIHQNNEFQVDSASKTSLVELLHQETIMGELINYYHEVDNIPSEVLYNLYLIYYICLDIDEVHNKFTKIYGKLPINDINNDDKYLRKMIELFILKILPCLNSFEDARMIINETPLLVDKHHYLEKITKLEDDRLHQLEQQKEVERKTFEKQHQEAKAANKLKDLKYKSLKQIKHASDNSNTAKSDPNAVSNEVVTKILYNFNLVKNYLKNNSPVLLLLLAILVAFRLLKPKNVNLMDNLKQTLSMAFKISYL